MKFTFIFPFIANIFIILPILKKYVHFTICQNLNRKIFFRRFYFTFYLRLLLHYISTLCSFRFE